MTIGNFTLQCCFFIDFDRLRANPLAGSPGQVKLESDKWKLWKNLF